MWTLQPQLDDIDHGRLTCLNRLDVTAQASQLCTNEKIQSACLCRSVCAMSMAFVCAWVSAVTFPSRMWEAETAFLALLSSAAPWCWFIRVAPSSKYRYQPLNKRYNHLEMVVWVIKNALKQCKRNAQEGKHNQKTRSGKLRTSQKVIRDIRVLLLSITTLFHNMLTENNPSSFLTAAHCRESFQWMIPVFAKSDCIKVREALRRSGINTSDVFPLHRKLSGREQCWWHPGFLHTPFTQSHTNKWNQTKNEETHTSHALTRRNINVRHAQMHGYWQQSKQALFVSLKSCFSGECHCMSLGTKDKQ